MRWLIRSFFKTLRLVLGPILLLKERLTAPAGLVRSQAQYRSASGPWSCSFSGLMPALASLPSGYL